MGTCTSLINGAFAATPAIVVRKSTMRRPATAATPLVGCKALACFSPISISPAFASAHRSWLSPCQAAWVAKLATLGRTPGLATAASTGSSVSLYKRSKAAASAACGTITCDQTCAPSFGTRSSTAAFCSASCSSSQRSASSHSPGLPVG